MTRIAALALPALILIAGCTDDDRLSVADSWAATAATPLGPPVDCIDRERVRGSNVRDARTIDFVMDDGSLMRSRLPYACPGLLPSGRFTPTSALPRLCSTDIVTMVRDDGGAAGQCGLGRFQPIALPAAQPPLR